MARTFSGTVQAVRCRTLNSSVVTGRLAPYRFKFNPKVGGIGRKPSGRARGSQHASPGQQLRLIPLYRDSTQNLRGPRETELAESFLLQAVTAWIGNSLSVAAKHYLQVRDEHFERAAAGSTEETGPQTHPKAAESGVLLPNPKKKEPQKTQGFSRFF
jgi:hypothetical protein